MATRVKTKDKGKKATGKSARGGRESSGVETPKSENKDTRETGKTLLGGLDAVRGFAETTSRVVRQAASILEEEIAAGILAAKQVEESLIDVKALRAGNSESVVNRLRKDAHEVVDILVDVVSSAVKYAEDMSRRAVSFRVSGNPQKAAQQESGFAPFLKVPGALKSGKSVQVPLTLENSGNVPTEELQFISTDLMNPAGGRIPAKQIAFQPSVLTIKPRGRETVLVQLKIPAETKPGLYSGLIQSSQMNQLNAILVVEVV